MYMYADPRQQLLVTMNMYIGHPNFMQRLSQSGFTAALQFIFNDVVW